MNAVALILSSAIIHAAWNSFAKKNATPYFEVLGIMSFATLFSLTFIPFIPSALVCNA